MSDIWASVVRQTSANTAVSLFQNGRALQVHENIAQSAYGPVIRCNFSCSLQCNSTLGRCKIGKYKFPSTFADVFLTYQTFVTNLHLLRV